MSSTFLRRILEREVIPDPRGVVGLTLILGVVASHLALASGPRAYLWSPWLPLEIAGHAWLLLGPPVSVYLGLRSLLVTRDSALPFVSVPLAAFVTVLTGVGVGVGLVQS
ncbi:MAG: hypothetical protein HY721_12530 [Planctomycetes bacterium]|nr:hypothetical protein [Planctomycetota bacterium]